MAGVAATVVLAAFDSTIISTTLPRVAEALDGMALYAWVGTGYLLTTAASILIFGRLGDMFGRKSLMLVSVLIVALGSIACGLAQSMEQLIAFRSLQGIGGGMMIATAFAAPADLFPDARQRVRWMAPDFRRFRHGKRHRSGAGRNRHTGPRLASRILHLANCGASGIGAAGALFPTYSSSPCR